MNNKVGVIILSYNRADVTIRCIDSLCYAINETPWEVYLLDNASQKDQYDLIEKQFLALKKKHQFNGSIHRSETNLGFPKGNNFGIKYFLEQTDVTHICLMNSDIIVTDHWLDRLLIGNYDAVGPVTNSCGNEQTIPYPKPLVIEDDNYPEINTFAQDRYQLFNNHYVKTDFLGFFCVIFKRDLVLSVGLLDEQFGRGSFEDDDYCIRIKSAGYQMVIARDVFVYHWGYSSFSQISQPVLRRHLRKNIHLFEKKHKIQWRDRLSLPLLGFQQDLRYALNNSHGEKYIETFSLYEESLTALFGSTHNQNRVWRNVRIIVRILHQLFKGKTIIFPVRYPTTEDGRDGYFQRVLAVDSLVQSHLRIYLNYSLKPRRRVLLPCHFIKDDILEIYPNSRNPIHILCLIALTILSGKIYCHSILRLEGIINRLLFMLSRRKIIDIHGVVPEEFEYHGDKKSALFFSRIERFAVTKANIIIGVTNKMVEHIKTKYAIQKSNKKYICLPNLPILDMPSKQASYQNASVIYCGGLHKWQQIEKMLDYSHRNQEKMHFSFLVPEPEEIRRIYSGRYKTAFPGIVEAIDHKNVSSWYEKNSYGLILRENVIVNAVACPTKLIEYLQYSIIPIVDSPAIGDFEEFGYRYISYKDSLPDERLWRSMIEHNRSVLKKIYDQSTIGKKQLLSSLK